jgi:SAM-dependent methyltransferase
LGGRHACVSHAGLLAGGRLCHGVAVSLVCDRLDGGSNLAIDRSATMIEMASRRNAALVASGRASFRTVALPAADFGTTRFDKIFAVHVPVLLRGSPDKELAKVRRHLAPDGRFYLPYQPPRPEQARQIAEALTSVLTKHGFTIARTVIEDLSARRVGCVMRCLTGENFRLLSGQARRCAASAPGGGVGRAHVLNRFLETTPPTS